MAPVPGAWSATCARCCSLARDRRWQQQVPTADNTSARAGASLGASNRRTGMGDIRQGAAAELWQSAIREACASGGRALDESQESYLVFVLLRHQRDERLLARIQALEWLDAQQQAGSARADALRDEIGRASCRGRGEDAGGAG